MLIKRLFRKKKLLLPLLSQLLLLPQLLLLLQLLLLTNSYSFPTLTPSPTPSPFPTPTFYQLLLLPNSYSFSTPTLSQLLLFSPLLLLILPRSQPFPNHFSLSLPVILFPLFHSPSDPLLFTKEGHCYFMKYNILRTRYRT